MHARHFVAANILLLLFDVKGEDLRLVFVEWQCIRNSLVTPSEENFTQEMAYCQL